MDNLTHSLAGALLGEMGLKRRSRFAMAGCILGANAPDIDVFAPRFLPVEGIAFHRGPTHAVIGWPLLAIGIVAILWLLDWLKPGEEASPEQAAPLPFRPLPLLGVTFLAVLTHPFLDWLNTYGINLLAPFSPKWQAGDAIFIIDWVYWLLMILGIFWSRRLDRHGLANPGRPARIMGLALAGYIALNLGVSTRAEAQTTAALTAQGIRPTMVVASPPPFLFWQRRMLWRDATAYGGGDYDIFHDRVIIEPQRAPLGLADPRLAAAAARSRHIRGFLYWSRMPLVVTRDGKPYLTDQRFYGQILKIGLKPTRFDGFLVPLDR